MSDETLRAALGAVIDRWYKAGLLRFNSHDDGSDDLLLRDELWRVVRALPDNALERMTAERDALAEDYAALVAPAEPHVVCHSWGWDDCAECQAELARRKAADECALGGGRCLTHGVADTPDHHFEQPRYQGKTD